MVRESAADVRHAEAEPLAWRHRQRSPVPGANHHEAASAQAGADGPALDPRW
jgi:hypothetical protein